MTPKFRLPFSSPWPEEGGDDKGGYIDTMWALGCSADANAVIEPKIEAANPVKKYLKECEKERVIKANQRRRNNQCQ